MAFQILVGTYTDAVYTLSFDPSKPATEALSLSSTLSVGFHPSWVERHPIDPSLVFTCLEQPEGLLLALRYDLQTGIGKVIASVPSGGHSPCSILVTETEVLVGNYMGGTVAFFKLLKTDSGDVTISEWQPPLQFSGSGPCTERQESSHPHQVYLVDRPAQRRGEQSVMEVLVPDLGADLVRRLRKDTAGRWAAIDPISFQSHPGGGPRHVIVKDSKLYTLLELTSQVAVHDLADTAGDAAPKFITDVRLPMPSDLPPLTMLAAEILLPSPNTSFPTPLLYVSNRNDPREHGDLISIFAVPPPPANGPQTLELVATVATGLKHVRNFIFFGPDDRYCIAGGANGGGIKVFERTEGGKNMKEIAHLPAEDSAAGLAPTSFVCL